MKYEGSCHCGNIEYEVEGEIESLIECNCSLCSRRGYLLFFVPKKNVKLKTSEQYMKPYTFNKHVIKHMFCTECGCAPFGFGSDGKGNETAAVNARCIQNIDLSKYAINKYDGKSA